MSNNKTQPSRRLALEIIMIFAVCFILALLLYLFLSFFSVGIIEEYCFNNDIYLDEDQLYHLDNTVFGVSFAVSAGFFVILFLALFGERLAYIRTIIDGIHALQRGEFGRKVELVGKNELTQLAEAVNYLSENERIIKEKEQKLKADREELVRNLSHDIRTPLTSIISYTELISSGESSTQENQQEYYSLVLKKAKQIKDLTDILLDGGKREIAFFENARLLMEQLAGEFEEMLEDHFQIKADLSGLPPFSGSFDVKELQRIFDNLISNITKYADPSEPITLSLSLTGNGLVMVQGNTKKKEIAPSDSYGIGINSIRRIAQNYGGSAEIHQDENNFEITVTFSEF